MKKDKDPTGRLRGIFFAVILIAELLIFTAESISLATGNSSLGSFIVHTAIYSALAISLSTGAYIFAARIFERLRRSEQSWERSFNASSEGMFILDRDLTIIRHNSALSELLGIDSSKIVGRKCYELLHHAAEPPPFCLTCRALQERRSVQAELYEPALGKYIFAAAGPSYDEHGGVEFVVHTVRDITVRKRAEEALRKSEERFRFLVENMDDNLFTLDLNARTTYTSPSVEKILGFTPQEHMAMTVDQQITPESLKTLMERLADEIVHDGERDPDRSVILEADFYHKNGSTVTLEVATSFIRDERGNPVGVLGLSRDITERKEAERRIREAERKYRELAETLPQAVFEMDMEGALTYVNETGLGMFGYTAEEAEKGISAIEVFAEEDRERVAGAIAKMATGRSAGAEREYTARRRDGTNFPCVVYTTLISDQRGRPMGIRGLLTDISERKRYEDELRRLNAELEGYAHTVSHDLKNPVSITAMACAQMQSMLEKQSLDPESRKAFERLTAIGKESIERTMKLIDDILLLAEAGGGKNLEPVDVTEIVKTVLSEHSQRIEERKLQVKVDPDLGTVMAAATHIYQLFANLVRNTLKHNASESPRLEIKLLDKSAGMLRYLVRDNGPGIPEEILGKIFVPFTRGGATGETGLGLSIVERVVKSYGGEIKAYNEGGACFEFTLPAAA
jgi:PAS domain S-box-containing protein